MATPHDADVVQNAAAVEAATRNPAIGSEQTDTTLAMLEAFETELAEAGPESVEMSSRFAFHLNDAERVEITQRIQAVLDEYELTDAERKRRNHPRVGGLFVLHRHAGAIDDDAAG